MSAIKEISTKPVAAKKRYRVDETGEEFDTKERAEEHLRDIAIIKERRARDFLIAENLHGWKWLNFVGHNYLVTTQVYEGRWREDERGKKEGLPTSGILSISMSDDGWNPPRYDQPEKIPCIIAALAKREARVLFTLHGGGKQWNCEITWFGRGGGTHGVSAQETREREFQSDTYLMAKCLHRAAAKYIEANPS